MAAINKDCKNNKNVVVVIVIVPYPAQSHLNMFLNLSHLVISSSQNNIPVHYVTSTQHLNQLKLRHPDLTNNTGLILREFPMPSCDKIADVFKSVHHLTTPVSGLLRSLSAKYDKVVVIHDALMASVVEDVTGVPNAKAYTFHTVSTFSIFVNLWRIYPDKPFALDPPDVLPSYLPSVANTHIPSDFGAFIAKEWTLNFQIDAGTLYNGSRAVEGTYVGLLEKLYPLKKHFAVGPTISNKFVPCHSKSDQNASTEVAADTRLECLTWLDNQKKDSVIFVSFGTTVSLPETVIQELATGLEKSGHKFMWVIRQADKGDIFTNGDDQEEVEVKKLLPDGFFERVGDRGMVISGEWVPQVEILGHHSVGGFMTHCGWGSLTESMTMGVPVIAYPMHSDQPMNSVLVTEVLKVGFLIRDDFWETRRQQTITSDIIENVVKKLMGSEEGEGMRKRAKDIGQSLRGSMAQGGASQLD
ncbi:zeatin O-glucosyltransferase-like [Silene latifolia]|uniref:zeatin O-glucosyltransferase-like n=1 Tax=Silene latifolia TaxID=37657 RepID=UPI003D7811F2